MLVYALIVAALLLLPVLGVLPIVISGTRDRNSAYAVWLQPPDASKWRTQSRRGVAAQEIAEWWLRWAGAAVLSAPLAWIVRDLPAAPLMQIVALFAGTLWAQVFARQFDLIGHTVEIVEAEREGRAGYASQEAARMEHGDLDGGGMTAAEILRAVDRRRWLARALLALLARRVDKVEA